MKPNNKHPLSAQWNRKGVQRDLPKPGQESVWDYPRPPRLEPSSRLVQVFCDDLLLAETRAAFRVLETSHPPNWYIPPADIRMQYLERATGSSLCEWKGAATYWTLVLGERTLPRVAWSYEKPTPAFRPIAGYLAFYPSSLNCFVDGEKVVGQAGSFYGGWITSDVVGPFKGTPGSLGW